MPIAFVAIVESMVMQLPHVDLTFILGVTTVTIALIALIVSVVTFYISHTRASRSEQIKMSWDLWERINEKYDRIREGVGTKEWPKDKSGYVAVPTHMVWSLIRKIDFLAYLILVEYIKDEEVLRYYKTYLSQYIEAILKYYTPPDRRYQVYEEYVYFNELITEWKINRLDEETT
jgi:hypothetical protein